jgi:hypothetical protein
VVRAGDGGDTPRWPAVTRLQILGSEIRFADLGKIRKMKSTRYMEWRAAITTAIVVAILLGAAIYQALELERLR